MVRNESRERARESGGQGGIAGPFFITPHAIDRYRQRIRPELTYERALRELVNACRGAHRVKVLGNMVEEWRGPKPLRLRLRVHKGVLLTVLPSSDKWRTPCR